MPDIGEVLARFRVDLGDSLAKISEFKQAIASVGEASGGGGGGGIAAMEKSAVSASTAIQTLSERVSTTGGVVRSVTESFVDLSDHVGRTAPVIAQMSSSMVEMTDRYSDMHRVSSDALRPLSQSTLDLMNSLPSLNGWVIQTTESTKGTSGMFSGLSAIMNKDLAPGIGAFVGGLSNAFMGMASMFYMVPMITMGLQSMGQGLYSAAAIAEGPAAHSFSSFTGQIDIMTAHSAIASQTFSEAFGKAVLPTLVQFNAAQASSGFSFDQWLGQAVGHMLVGNPFQAASNLFQTQAGPSNFTDLTTSAGELREHFVALNAVTGQTTLSVSQAGSVFYQMQHEPLGQQLIDIQSGAYTAAMMATPERITFSAPTFMGQFTPPMYAPPPSQYYAPPPAVVGPGTTYMPGLQQPPTITGAIDIGRFLVGGSKSVWDFISGESKSVWNFITGESKSIWDFLSGGGGPPKFATGIEGFGGGLALVGEKGPELLRLPGGASVYPMTGGTSLAGSSGGASSGQTLAAHIYIGTTEIASYMAPLIVAEIRQQAGIRR